ncbi:MAG: TlpA family protein disulfide reductase [Acidobacteriota bacterium]
MRSVVSAFLTIVLVASALPGCSRRGGEAVAGDAPGRDEGPAAPVTFADLDRIHRELASHRGHPVLLNFWATWCVPCIRELPTLASLAREYEPDGPAFVGVSFDAWVTGAGEETERLVREYLAAAGVSYPNLIYSGEQDPILSGYDLPGSIPYSILFDAAGRRAADWDGALDAASVREAVDSLP